MKARTKVVTYKEITVYDVLWEEYIPYKHPNRSDPDPRYWTREEFAYWTRNGKLRLQEKSKTKLLKSMKNALGFLGKFRDVKVHSRKTWKQVSVKITPEESRVRARC